MTVPGSIEALMLGGGGYQIERSLRFNSADSAYLNRTPASTTETTAWTWSGWVKRSASGNKNFFGAFYGFNGRYFTLGFNSSDRLEVYGGNYSVNINPGVNIYLITTAVYRDFSAWMHVVLTYDSANATSTDRARLYVNGSRITDLNTATYPGLSSSTYVNYSTTPHYIGTWGGGTAYLDGYLTEIHFVSGQALTPSSFGETDTITGVWKPKAFSGGSYGTNGFYLNFKNNSSVAASTLGKDYSGNGNNWTPSATFSVTAGAGNDSLIDTPTPYADGGNGRANYPTWNPLTNGNVSVSNGNLDCTYASAAWQNIKSTMAMPASGKWYAEITQNSAATYWNVGVCNGSFPNSYYGGQDANSWAWQNGNKYNNGSPTGYGTAGVSGDVFMVAVNRATNSIWLGKNGTWFSGDPAAGTTPMYSNLDASGDLFFMAAMYAGAAHIANFGQRSFSYTPPSGFLALNTQNLPEPSIKKPSSYMGVSLWTGTGSNQTISGLGFQPDLIWAKNRNLGNSHVLFDSVRGFNSNKPLYSDTTWSEGQYQYADIKSVNSDGYVVGAGASGDNYINYNTLTYVGWSWKESATPGFDIVTYTGNGVNGRTVSHSLGVTPSMIIVKNRSTAGFNWQVWHTSLTTNNNLLLDSTIAQFNPAGAAYGGPTAPTSTTFTCTTGVTSAGSINANTNTYVAYLFSEVAGFSKFGSYTGNGSSDGPFVFTGMRPRWIMVKRSDSTANWTIRDTARRDYNSNILGLFPNLSAAEDSTAGRDVDMLSNGFKIRGTDTDLNASGGTYVFAAFSESAFKYSLAR